MADSIQIASSKIAAKHSKLKQRGFDLGSKTSQVIDVEFGGFFQDFQKGRIYTHHSVGTFEVHGGILNKYKSRGEFGRSAFTRRRELGFPKSDEKRTIEGFPKSLFEWGEIIYLPGTDRGVALSGSIYNEWTSRKKTYGYPVTSNMRKGNTEIVFFERGIAIKNSASVKPIWVRLLFPLIGSPAVTKSNFTNLPIKLSLKLNNFNELGGITGLNKLLKGKVALRPVIAKNEIVPLKAGKFIPGLKPFNPFSRKSVTVFLVPVGLTIKKRFDHSPKLYDFVCQNESNTYYDLSPHCIYSRNNWKNFGILHATDIHVSKRIDGFRGKFMNAKIKHPNHSQKIDQGLEALNNWNNGFRDFIRYANAMHKEGVVDGIIATGDLVDYLFEKGENLNGGGNFKFFRDIVLGRSPYPEGQPIQQELLVPIFTSLGNHDYRVKPYEVYQRIDIPIISDEDVKQYGPYNLSKFEARIIQNGNPDKFNKGDEGRIKVSTDTAKEQVIPSTKIEYWKKDHLAYYKSYINRGLNRLVLLDKHKIMLLDTGPDVGSPDGKWDTWDAITTSFGFGDSNEEAFQNRHAPNSRGPDSWAYNRLKQIKSGDGIIIVGMHAPPINTFGNEYPHYFRETEHSVADELETVNFIRRHKKHIFRTNNILDNNKRAKDRVRVKYPNWLTKSNAFKFGSHKEFIDNGVSRGDIITFLKLLCGLEGSKKPIDVLLCGHDHTRSEIRLKWNVQNSRMEYYTDFYTENPERFHTSKKYRGEKGEYDLVKIYIKNGAQVNQATTLTKEVGNDVKQLEIPPYSKPLNKATNKKNWWQQHKPLLIQGAPLGPKEHTNRTRKLPAPSQPSNEGCKLLIIRDDQINNIIHISRRELLKPNYSLPNGVSGVSFGNKIVSQGITNSVILHN